MSLLHIDGFEYDPQSLNENAVPALGFGKATSMNPGVAQVAGRRAISNALRIPDCAGDGSGGYSKTINANQLHVYMGVALNIATPGSFNVMVFHIVDTTNAIVHMVEIDSLGQVQLKRNGIPLGQSSNAIAFGVWNFVEFHAFNSASAGVLEVKVNGVTWLSSAGLNTRQSGGDFKQFGLGTPPILNNYSSQADYDDFYLLNNSGTTNNAWLGDVRVDVLRPNAAGSNTGFTATPVGDNYQRVDEAATDLNDFVQSTAVGQRDTYSYSDVPAMVTPTILAVQLVSVARKTDSGVANIKNIVKSGATIGSGSTDPLLQQSASYLSVFETNPNTATQWTEAGVNAAEFGIEAA